jgi:hypothetical protein
MPSDPSEVRVEAPPAPVPEESWQHLSLEQLEALGVVAPAPNGPAPAPAAVLAPVVVQGSAQTVLGAPMPAPPAPPPPEPVAGVDRTHLFMVGPILFSSFDGARPVSWNLIYAAEVDLVDWTGDPAFGAIALQVRMGDQETGQVAGVWADLASAVRALAALGR